MKNFQTLLRKRRSIREFQDRDVPPEVVREIIRETCLAPSAMNTVEKPSTNRTAESITARREVASASSFSTCSMVAPVR